MNILNSLINSSLINEQLEEFIEINFQEIYDFFYNQTQIDLYNYKKEIKKYLRQAKKMIISLDCSSKINGDFIALIVETCEKLHLVMEFKLFYDYLSKCGYRVGKRLEASAYYCGNIRKFYDYYDIYPSILTTLNEAYISNESEHKEILTTTFINFYLSMVYDFGERNKENILKLKNEILLKYKKEKYHFLDEELVNTIFSINIDNYQKAYDDSIQILNSYLYTNGLMTCKLENFIQIEVSEYSKKLKKYSSLTFDDIFQTSKYYVENNIKDEQKIHYSLNRGTKILKEEEGLYQYIKSFGKMHKAKLYSSFDTVIHKLNNQSINIIDWGCGQALASLLLIEYIKEKNLNTIISNIILIEPSDISLSRGMLHIDVLNENNIDVKAINKDIDSLEIKDLIIKNSNITLHLFSNILDVEFFRLDKVFLEKISDSQKGLNYFICVSPNINDKRNTRLDMFHRYFTKNFKAKLISQRDCNVGRHKRYEKVFKAVLSSKETKK